MSHAEMRPARFVVDPRLLASHLPGLAIQGSAATNASCPRYASRNAYLPYIMHGCDRFDLSRGRLRVASRSPSATSPPNYVLRRMRCNTQSTYCKFQVNRAGRQQIESVALCVWQRHLRNVSTLSNRTRQINARRGSLEFYAILPIPNFLFQGRFDYSDTASFSIK